MTAGRSRDALQFCVFQPRRYSALACCSTQLPMGNDAHVVANLYSRALLQLQSYVAEQQRRVGVVSRLAWVCKGM